jgi:hypothetical protein
MLLRFVIAANGKHLINGPHIVLSVTSTLNETERRSLSGSLFETGARRTQIIDRNIEYAYIKKQPDPWGRRAFYFNCTREGGDSGWLRDNLNQMKESPAPHEITARWTFRGQWDPEACIRELWNILAY